MCICTASRMRQAGLVCGAPSPRSRRRVDVEHPRAARAGRPEAVQRAGRRRDERARAGPDGAVGEQELDLALEHVEGVDVVVVRVQWPTSNGGSNVDLETDERAACAPLHDRHAAGRRRSRSASPSPGPWHDAVGTAASYDVRLARRVPGARRSRRQARPLPIASSPEPARPVRSAGHHVLEPPRAGRRSRRTAVTTADHELRRRTAPCGSIGTQSAQSRDSSVTDSPLPSGSRSPGGWGLGMGPRRGRRDGRDAGEPRRRRERQPARAVRRAARALGLLVPRRRLAARGARRPRRRARLRRARAHRPRRRLRLARVRARLQALRAARDHRRRGHARRRRARHAPLREPARLREPLPDPHRRARRHARPGPRARAAPAATTLDVVAAHAEGLVCLSGCARHGLGTLDPNGAARLARAFPGAFYVELQRPFERGDARRNAALEELAAALGVPTVATGDVHAHHPRRARLQDALVAIAQPHLARRLRARAARQPRGRPPPARTRCSSACRATPPRARARSPTAARST